MNSAAAYAALITSIAGLLGVVVWVINWYVKKPEDLRLNDMKKVLDEKQKEVDYLTQRNQELEGKLADATVILIEFPKLRDQVSRLQKEVEDLRPRVMEYEKLSKKHLDLQNAYEELVCKNNELEIKVQSYEDIFAKALAMSKEAINGTSINSNPNPAGSSSTSS